MSDQRKTTFFCNKKFNLTIIILGAVLVVLMLFINRSDIISPIAEPELPGYYPVAPLDLSGQFITDEILKEMILSGEIPNDTTEINLVWNEIHDVTPLSSLTQLKNLNIEDNYIDDISPLSSLNSLITLSIGSNRISDITVFETLSQIEYLSLSRNEIKNIRSLSYLTQLKILNMNYNQINSIAPLSILKNMTNLVISNNPINDLSPLASLEGLELLKMENIGYKTDITPLSFLINLEELFIGEGNQINDLAPLESLPNLALINIDNDLITDERLEIITPFLAATDSLDYLMLRNNKISDITPLASLTGVKALNLSNNQISDLTPLFELSQLRLVHLRGNPLSESQLDKLRSALPDCVVNFSDYDWN